MEYSAYLEFFLAVLRSSAPLVLASIAALFCERSGIIQIALEGFMLFGAFVGAVAAFWLGGWSGLLLAGLCGALMAYVFAVLVLSHKVDQIIAGTVINMLAWGALPLLCRALFDSSASTPSLDMSQRLSGATPILLAALVVLLVHTIFMRSPAGLWLTFAGEKPEALTAVGISPRSVRYTAILICGFLAAVSGATLSICLSSSYTRNMTAGRGFMALAALILGKWRTLPVTMSCLLFGFFDVIQLKTQGVNFPLIGVIPNQLLQLAPYVVTLIILAGSIGQSRAPAVLGRST